MTINDIKNAKFDSCKRGYRVEEVDDFLDKICDYIQSLQDEKSSLLKKMEVLARKVEEYRKDEESIREALLGAQKLGKSVLNEAKEKAAALEQESETKSKQMLSEAKTESDRILNETKEVAQSLLIKSKAESDKMISEAEQSVEITLKETKYEIEKEQNNLIRTQKEVSLFKSQLLDLYRTHIDLIKKIPELEQAEREAKEKETRELDKQIYEQQTEDQKVAEQPLMEENTEVPAETANEVTPAVEEATLEADTAVTEIEQIQSQETKEYQKPEEQSVTDDVPGVTTETIFAPEAEKEESSKEHYVKKFGELKFGNNSK